MKRAFSVFMFVLLLVSTLTFAFNTQNVKASGTIYIRADGSIDPPDAPISTVDNATYTLTGNITSSADGIVVERNNIIVDGAGYTIQGTSVYYFKGIDSTGRSNVTIENVKVEAFEYGICLEDSNNNSICGNTMINISYGIWLRGSASNEIAQNNISCWRAIDIEQYGGFENMEKSSNNKIVENNIEHRGWGVRLSWSSNNTLRGNNITGQVYRDSTGVLLSSSFFNEIAQNTIRNNEIDISLGGSHGNNIVQNNISTTAGWSSYGYTGISLSSSTFNTIGQNVIAQNYYGILLGYSYPGGYTNTIYHNNFVNNTYGIYLQRSSNYTISGNSFWNDGLFVQDSYENSVVDNLVNGKPLVYLEGASGLGVEDAGQVILVGCNNITIENLNLSNTVVAIQLWKTDNTKISSNNIANNMYGIWLHGSNNTISTNNIANNGRGIFLDAVWPEQSSNNTISANNITVNNWEGIWLQYSSNNSIVGNNITNNSMGIWLDQSSSNNTISGNNITNSQFSGIYLGSSYNKIWHNNFINNTRQASSGWVNAWDDGYPSGGNYWSDYNGTDLHSSLYQNETGSDGIGDTPYAIDEDNVDNYLLMAPYGTFDAGTWDGTAYNVDVISNSTVSGFQFNPSEGALLRFNVTGEDGTSGFCRVTIPKDLLWVEDGQWIVLVGGVPITNYTITPDENCAYLHFNYNHSTRTVQIQGTQAIPEFPSFLILPLFMIATLLAVIVYRKKYAKISWAS